MCISSILFIIHLLFSNCEEIRVEEAVCEHQHHHSWTSTNIASPQTEEIQSVIDTLSNLPHIEVPVYDIKDTNFNPNDPDTQFRIYDSFYNKVGALIVSGVYSNNTMSQYNQWCETFLEIAKNDPNCRHPKQPGKYLINDVMMRLGRDNPDLLMQLVNNQYFTLFTDILLGFMKFGAVTTHWIEAGGDRQLSHVDYPIHVGSGPFWENDVNKLMKLTTRYQLNKMLPYYSVQVLIASDKMNSYNGATELIPASHLIPNIDALILDNELYNAVESYFISVDLKQGDMLIFNRRLLHRGGRNKSDKRRNSLIMQCVWLWGVGQEIIQYDELTKCLQDSYEFGKLSKQEKEVFLTRIKPPYPADIKKQT